MKVMKKKTVSYVLLVTVVVWILVILRNGTYQVVDSKPRVSRLTVTSFTTSNMSFTTSNTSFQTSKSMSFPTSNTSFFELDMLRPDRKVLDDDKYVNIRTYGKNVSNDFTTKVEKASLDIMSVKPIRFDPAYKNPCWFSDEHNTLFNDTRLHCLPYFFLIGVKKSGTTDLFFRLMQHPQFLRPSCKESQWFPRIRFKTQEKAAQFGTHISKRLAKAGQDNKNVTFYINMFNRVARNIKSCHMEHQGNVYHHCITGDGTPANFHINTYWELLPGNEGLDEPRYTNFNYIKHLIPDAKLIVIFRDPVTRLYSDFLHSTKNVRRADEYTFHQHCVTLVRAYSQCFQLHTRRQCVYNNTIIRNIRIKGNRLADSFMASFYEVYMRDIYQTFEAHNVLTILQSAYAANMEYELRRVFRFLDLYQPSSQVMQKALGMKVANTSRKKKYGQVGPMLNVTSRMLYNFFQPHNVEMAKLMSDDRYLFKQPES